MKTRSIKLIYFSPTHTTQQTLRAIGRGMIDNSQPEVERPSLTEIDLTRPGKRETLTVDAHDLVIIGAPVYAGRLPRIAVERLHRLQGQETPAVLVVVYGNRAFEDALLELKDLVAARGFVPIAAGAFIGEHSYHKPATPIAPGRPDGQDLARAAAFGEQIHTLLAGLDNPGTAPPLHVPGNRPYRTRGAPSESAPETNSATCTLCGTCADVCPTAAIEVTDRVITDGLSCILCCACVKACPTAAQIMNDDHVLRIAAWLSEEHGERREPEIFLQAYHQA